LNIQAEIKDISQALGISAGNSRSCHLTVAALPVWWHLSGLGRQLASSFNSDV